MLKRSPSLVVPCLKLHLLLEKRKHNGYDFLKAGPLKWRGDSGIKKKKGYKKKARPLLPMDCRFPFSAASKCQWNDYMGWNKWRIYVYVSNFCQNKIVACIILITQYFKQYDLHCMLLLLVHFLILMRQSLASLAITSLCAIYRLDTTA